jgi:adenylate kinase
LKLARYAIYLQARAIAKYVLMFNLVLFGPPGSGKGTQSALIIEKYRLVHISTGDILRKEVADQTPLGLEAKKFMDAGQLVPDEVVIGMIGSKLDENEEAPGYIFDGFPRTVAQAEALDKLLDFKKAPITTVVSLVVPEQELIARLVNRGKESGRSDDNEATAKKRYQEYLDKTAPVAEYYHAQEKYNEVEGVGSIDEIFHKICNEIDAHTED